MDVNKTKKFRHSEEFRGDDLLQMRNEAFNYHDSAKYNIEAAIFATKPRTNDIEHSLNAYALLFEGERPVWEIHIEGKVFEYISSPEDILEEGVKELNKHCQPTNQAIDLLHSGIHFTLLT